MTFRRIWRSYLVSLVTPLLFLTVFGVGVGRLIDRSGELHGSYLSFLAPGLLVGTAMQNGALVGFGPIMGRIRWDPIYDSMLHSPLGVLDVLAGELVWIALRLTVTCGVFLTAVVALGAADSLRVLLCWPVAVLVGLAFAVVFMAVAGWAPNGYAYDVLSRVVIIPLFMFGGVFFPVGRLPAPLRWVVELTPIEHGTALARAVVSGAPGGSAVLVHLAVLAGYLIGGFLAAGKAFKCRLCA